MSSRQTVSLLNAASGALSHCDKRSIIGAPVGPGERLKRALLLPADEGSVGWRRDCDRFFVDAVDDIEGVGNPGDVFEGDAQVCFGVKAWLLEDPPHTTQSGDLPTLLT